MHDFEANYTKATASEVSKELTDCLDPCTVLTVSAGSTLQSLVCIIPGHIHRTIYVYWIVYNASPLVLHIATHA